MLQNEITVDKRLEIDPSLTSSLDFQNPQMSRGGNNVMPFYMANQFLQTTGENILEE